MNALLVSYAISDRDPRNGGTVASLLRQTEWLAEQGVEFFQIREKDLAAGNLALLCRRVLAATRGSSTRVVVNGRADVAVAVGAHGVHLTSGPDELVPAQVRRLYAEARRSPPVVTVACHTIAEVERRRTEGADVILFGPVFEKFAGGEWRAAGSGVALLAEACRAAGSVPVLALGGITAANAGECLEAGAKGIAGIRIFQRAG